ncbi:hypothetical protein GQX73_g9788 [Xylaria multiplex]|uniref:C2H2-type domain-containing protein n=1 Tax=Xylaria multiplex TaxID=323545 RepID=A0A7C8ITY6_9PEZI|nr:hypothetical protein GQX73_g9788 [Xylaria multiplex]
MMSSYTAYHIWFCCNCSDGPLSYKFVDSCPECSHYRCDGCESRSCPILRGSIGNSPICKSILSGSSPSTTGGPPVTQKEPLETEASYALAGTNDNYSGCSRPGTHSPRVSNWVLSLNTFDPLVMAGGPAGGGNFEGESEICIKASESINIPRGKQSNQEHREDHAESSLDDLSALLHRLNLDHKAAHCSMILQACDEIWKCAPSDGGEHEIQGSSATPSVRSSQASSISSNKRLRQGFDDSDNEENGHKKLKITRSRAIDTAPDLFLACPFYMLNPYIYYSCSQFKGGDISKIGNHLRKAHAGEYHCVICYKSFESSQQEDFHIQEASCRSTRGPSVLQILPISKTKGKDGKERWYWIWGKLFPNMRPPKSPWWSRDVEREQIMLSVVKRLRDRDESLSPLVWTRDLLSQWKISPPEHLPDLQKELEPEADNRGINTVQELSADTPGLASLVNLGREIEQTNTLEELPLPAYGFEENFSFFPLRFLSIGLSSATDDLGPSNQVNTAVERKERENFIDAAQTQGQNTALAPTEPLLNNANLPLSAPFASSEGEPIHHGEGLNSSPSDASGGIPWSDGIALANSLNQYVAGEDETDDWGGVSTDDTNYGLSNGIGNSIDSEHFNLYLGLSESDTVMGSEFFKHFLPLDEKN